MTPPEEAREQIEADYWVIPALKYLAEKCPERFRVLQSPSGWLYYFVHSQERDCWSDDMLVSELTQDDADEILAALPEPRKYIIERDFRGGRLLLRLFTENWILVSTQKLGTDSKRDAAHAAIVAAVEEIKQQEKEK